MTYIKTYKSPYEESHSFTEASNEIKCAVCGCSESDSIYDCPERIVTEEEKRLIAEGKLNYLDGYWVEGNPHIVNSSPPEFLQYWQKHVRRLKAGDVISLSGIQRANKKVKTAYRMLAIER